MRDKRSHFSHWLTTMAHQVHLSFKLVVIIYGLFQGVSGIDDFTCVTKPRINSSDQTFIKGILVGQNGTLSFWRTTDTGTSNTSVPQNLVQTSTQGIRALTKYTNTSTLDMSVSEGRNRIGVFACTASINAKTVMIETVIMSSNAHLLPSFVSKTVNLGDDVSLSVKSLNNSLKETRWRKNGSQPFAELNGSMFWNITNANTNDSGVYECHFLHHRGEGIHAIFRLIVRGCQRDKWRLPDCNHDCPLCLNGGVCDDVSGACICPPGFSGTTCKTFLGPNRFGQNGSLQCSSVQSADGTTCRGMLFCLADPYGCSCAAGYQGLNCTEVCERGTYGANCAQTCHCEDASKCNTTTGQCSKCAPGYNGTNCQECSFEPMGLNRYSNQDVTSSNPNIHWKKVSCERSNISIENYILEIVKEENDSFEKLVKVEGTNNVNVTLSPCTTYTFRVAAELNNGTGTYSSGIVFSASPRGPDVVANLTIKKIESDNLTVSWTAPGNNPDNPCLANGYLVTFELLKLNERCQNDSELTTSQNTTNTTLTIGGLKANSTYRVNVTSTNEAGHGETVSRIVTTGETEPPAAPVTDPNGNATDSSLTFFWNPVPCVSRYQYDFRRDGGNTLNTNFTSSNFISFAGLSPCTSYSFSVKAFTSENASSRWTSRISQRTSGAVPDPVVNLTIIKVDHDKLRVLWTAPGNDSDNLCHATGYMVTHDLLNIGQCLRVNELVGSSNIINSSITIDELKAYSTYRVNVTSKNQAGYGETVSLIITTGETEPAAPVIDVNVNSNESSLAFSWAPVPCVSRGGNITRYQYDFKRSDESTSRKSYTTSYFAVFEGLLPCTSYSFRVRAWASNNKSKWTTTITRNTSESAPGSVTMLEAVYLSATKINITWQRPNDTTCHVDDYTIDYELLSMDQCEEALTRTGQIESAMSPATITDLYPHSTYRFYVKAYNRQESGNDASIEVTTSGSEPGGSPTDLKATVATNTTLNFAWSKPKCGLRNGNITTYLLNLVNTANGSMKRRSISSTHVTFTNLVPYTAYNLSVSAVNQFGSGPFASITNRTLEGIPPAPGNVSFLSKSSDQIIVAWLPPNPPHGIITRYDIRYWKTSNELTTKHKLTATPQYQLHELYVFQEINKLESWISYSFEVRAQTQIGTGPWSVVAEASTKYGVPTKPDSVIAKHIGLTSITLHWNKPQFPNGRIRIYKVGHRVLARPYDDTFKFDNSTSFKSQLVVGPSSLRAVITDLEPSTKYEVHIWAVNDAGVEGLKKRLDVYTQMATDFPAPDKPTLIGKESTISSIAIGLVSKIISKYISHYQIGVRNMNGDWASTGKVNKRSVPEFLHHTENPSTYVAAELSGELPVKFVVGDNKTYGIYWNPPLQEGAVYEIYVGAVSRINETMANVKWNSDPLVVEVDGDYSEPDSSVFVVVTIITILLLIVLILLVLLFMKKRRTAKAKNRKADTSADSTSSIQVELQVRCSTSRVQTSNDLSVKSPTESNNETENEQNAQKDKSTTPSTTGIAQTTYVLSDDTSKPGPSVRPKHNEKSKLKSKSSKTGSVSCTEPVAMTELARFIKARKSGKINGFQQDFETLPAQPTHPHDIAMVHENKKKNRYNNIPAYDHSRVLLEPIEGCPHSDYINASYINGYKHEAKYIACQGPNQTTVNDMWRMIWQEQVGQIVMLTNIVEKEKEKCVKYWPDEGSCDFGEIFVRNVNEEKTLNFIVRTFNLSKSSEPEGEYREILQYHYITWPDMKPPESSSLLQFIRRVQASETTQQGPIVVHCSAGVGRTGTYIALDAMLEQAQADGQVDVLNFVREMRDKRYMMVQTMDQLKFIYEALLESSLSENTAISVDRFSQDLTKLKKRDKKTGTDGVEDQFKMLDTFTATMSDDQCYGGRHPDNADKNRFADCIPRDSTRPYLMTDGGEGSTNYINASFLDGFKGKHSYLATQAPLPSTIGDIWRMVFDYKSPCIVMLNSMDNELITPQYWPDDGSMSVGPLTVKLLSVDQSNEDMIVRQFSVQNTVRNKEEMQTVCHIQFLQWPTGKDIPNSPSSLLKVLETVKMWTQKHPDEPVTVQCIDGEGCSGTFCALVTLLDRLEQDGVIDVFQEVKQLRSARAGMVKSLAQYQLCYQVMTWYLGSASGSSIYENLRR